MSPDRRPLPPPARAGVATLTLTLAALALPAALGAQPFPRVGGGEVRIGAVGPEGASAGFGLAGDLDLGALGAPTLGSLGRTQLRALVGLHFFRADAELPAEAEERQASGSFQAIGGRAGLRLDLSERWGMVPYAVGHVSAYDVDAGAIADAPTRARLEGVAVGGGAGVGVAVGRDRGGRSTVLELRQVWVNEVAHWTAEVGIRWGPRRGPDDERADALLARERQRLLGERLRQAPPADAGAGAAGGGALPAALASLARTAPTVGAVRETDRGWEVALVPASFAAGAAAPSPAAAADLARLGAALALAPAHPVLVEVRADAAADASLAGARAAAVRDALVAAGVAPARITAAAAAAAAAAGAPGEGATIVIAR